MALIFAGNMRVGYACAAMLAKAEVVETESGEMRLRPPTPDQAGEIWLRFLETSTAGKPPAAQPALHQTAAAELERPLVNANR